MIKLTADEIDEEVGLRKSPEEPYYHIYSRVGLIGIIHERDETIRKLNKTILTMRKKIKTAKVLTPARKILRKEKR